MRRVPTFEECLQKGSLISITPDKQRSQYLYLQAKRKRELLEENIKKIGITTENANDYIEYCYNILMIFIRAHMFEQGYKTQGQGSHEAEVSFAKRIGFRETELDFLNQLRYFRNGILYYGQEFDTTYAKKVISFTKQKITTK